MERGELISVLGVSETPTTGEIRLARRQAARRLHPDSAGDPTAAAMAELNEAADRWIDEIRRARDAPTVAMPAAYVQSPSTPSSPPPAARGGIGPVYVVATIALMAVITAVVVIVAGPSVVSFAIGALCGAAGAAIYLVILRRLPG